MTMRIAMWSGPRNISTAMMRAFENRTDTAVIDEPFYAAYLALTGLDHPMREEVLRTQPLDARVVADALVGPIQGGRAVYYQKHMTHHMLPSVPRDWMVQCRSAFLIRPPEAVLASYTAKRETVTLDDIGFVQQAELFEREADRLGRAPPVIEAGDVLADPRGILSALCASLEIGFEERMLSWPSGRRDTDGVWGQVWYDTVERSTSFAPPRPLARLADLPDHLRPIADAARPHFQRLATHKLTPQPG